MGKENDTLKMIGSVILGCATIAGTLYALIYAPLNGKIENNCLAIAAESKERTSEDNIIKKDVSDMKTRIYCTLTKISTKMGIEDDRARNP